MSFIQYLINPKVYVAFILRAECLIKALCCSFGFKGMMQNT